MVIGFFGLPGCGKTSLAVRFAQKELKRIEKGRSNYERVFTNFYCKGCFKINYKDLGVYDFSNSLILLDEITLDADSRNFKQFTAEKKEFFLMHRHYNCDIMYFTQQWDGVDKKIRDITQMLYRVKKPLLPFFDRFTFATQIYRVVEINEYTKEIVQGYRFPNWFERLFFRTHIAVYRPKLYHLFDSWSGREYPIRPHVPWDPVEESENVNLDYPVEN